MDCEHCSVEIKTHESCHSSLYGVVCSVCQGNFYTVEGTCLLCLRLTDDPDRVLYSLWDKMEERHHKIIKELFPKFRNRSSETQESFLDTKHRKENIPKPRVCSKCTYENKYYKTQCEMCFNTLNIISNKVPCHRCTFINEPGGKKCAICDTPFQKFNDDDDVGCSLWEFFARIF
jgi:hypothetical protein